MTARIQKGKLAIAKELYDFIENEALPGSGLDSETYWKNFEQVVVDLSPKNKALLAKRDDIQAISMNGTATTNLNLELTKLSLLKLAT